MGKIYLAGMLDCWSDLCNEKKENLTFKILNSCNKDLKVGTAFYKFDYKMLSFRYSHDLLELKDVKKGLPLKILLKNLLYESTLLDGYIYFEVMRKLCYETFYNEAGTDDCAIYGGN